MSRSMKEEFPGIELGSVDGFQGREKEAVVVSLVRSNSEHEVGFLGEKRRLNGMICRLYASMPKVYEDHSIFWFSLPHFHLKLTRHVTVAMTRPRRSLAIIGDSETVGSGSAYLKHWMDFLEEHSDLRYPSATT